MPHPARNPGTVVWGTSTSLHAPTMALGLWQVTHVPCAWFSKTGDEGMYVLKHKPHPAQASLSPLHGSDVTIVLKCFLQFRPNPGLSSRGRERRESSDPHLRAGCARRQEGCSPGALSLGQ